MITKGIMPRFIPYFGLILLAIIMIVLLTVNLRY